MKRRDFLKLMGMASTATLLSSCGVERTTEKLIPFLIPPSEDYIPGESYFYASTCTECPAHCGLSVKVRDFNPIKLEGNADHPLNSGALCIRGQSSIMRLYHPERVKQPLMRDASGKLVPVSWKEALGKVAQALQESGKSNKQNIYLASRTTGSLAELIDWFCQRADVERFPEYELFNHAAIRQANALLFGQNDIPGYNIEAADFLLTVGADLLETFVSPVRYTRQISRARKAGQLSWYHAEPHASLTGFKADYRLRIAPRSEPYLLAFLVDYVVTNKLNRHSLPTSMRAALPKFSVQEVSKQTGLDSRTLNELGLKLGKAQNPLIISGGVSTAHDSGLEVALLTGLLQWLLGMTESTVDFTHSENYHRVGSQKDVARLVRALENGQVGVLMVSRANPLGTAVPELKLADAVTKADLRVALTQFLDETAQVSDVVLPLSHAMESWGDAESRRGLVSVMQPTVEPLWDTRSEGDVLISLAQMVSGKTLAPTYQEWLFQRWKQALGSNEAVDAFLKKGYYEKSVPAIRVDLDAREATRLLANAQINPAVGEGALVAAPSIRTFDGRSAILPLIPEIPDPLTTISYGEWVSVSPAVARAMNAKDGHQVRLKTERGELLLALKKQPGLAEGVSVVHRDQLPADFFTMEPRTGEVKVLFKRVSLEKTGVKVAIPILSGSQSQHGRGLIPKNLSHREGHGEGEGGETLYPPHEHKTYRWGMAIDLDACVACSACVAACHIENNVPWVGKEEHLKGREMSWIRVEPYYDDQEHLDTLIMLCQQCDNAPCESVCPVFATYHNPEGLNAMVYNRCVGTRYCHNNCPYKVRRFNWFDHEWPEPMDRMINPEIWKRPKGVMEKCTFCVQRIRKAEDLAKDEGRLVQDGDIVPACAQTCPTDAIVFGNLLDEEARVSKLAHSEHAFRVFEVLGVEPAVHYLYKGDWKHES